jgi:hypothetical protein
MRQQSAYKERAPFSSAEEYARVEDMFDVIKAPDVAVLPRPVNKASSFSHKIPLRPVLCSGAEASAQSPGRASAKNMLKTSGELN